MARVTAGAKLVPVTAGMVVLAYNLPGLTAPLKLSRDVYTDIFASQHFRQIISGCRSPWRGDKRGDKRTRRIVS